MRVKLQTCSAPSLGFRADHNAGQPTTPTDSWGRVSFPPSCLRRGDDHITGCLGRRCPITGQRKLWALGGSARPAGESSTPAPGFWGAATSLVAAIVRTRGRQRPPSLSSHYGRLLLSGSVPHSDDRDVGPSASRAPRLGRRCGRCRGIERRGCPPDDLVPGIFDDGRLGRRPPGAAAGSCDRDSCEPVAVAVAGRLASRPSSHPTPSGSGGRRCRARSARSRGARRPRRARHRVPTEVSSTATRKGLPVGTSSTISL